jgi:hypothetical protein
VASDLWDSSDPWDEAIGWDATGVPVVPWAGGAGWSQHDGPRRRRTIVRLPSRRQQRAREEALLMELAASIFWG